MYLSLHLLLLAQPLGEAAWLQALRLPLTAGYLGLLLLIGAYGLHRYWLVWTYQRYRRDLPRPQRRFDPLPRVTVQLPMYNEGPVSARIIDAAAAIDYPAELLQIQVLDDSTDGSDRICQERVDYWKARGLDIALHHRTDRTGFKAGALAAALPDATGEFVAIFDADFVPPPGFLRRTIHHFSDETIGMVQTRWDHLNRTDSLLTRSQAIFLDGHFVIEHTARCRSGRWFNFSGTGGVWRRQAIDDAGGWSHDTLTEDMDLSYRAQLAGWEFLFLPSVTCPAELPPEINAFKSQQHRWTKGMIQTAMKVLPRVLKSKASFKIKTEAFFHLTSPMVYIYVNLFALLFFPALAVNVHGLGSGTWYGILFGLSLFALGALSASVFYITSQRILKRGFWVTVLQMPMLMSVGIGIALNNAVACVEALIGHQSPFIRTPKYNVGATRISKPSAERSEASDQAGGALDEPTQHQSVTRQKLGTIIPIPSLKRWTIALEFAFGLYMSWCAYLSLQDPRLAMSLPFLLLFAVGYLYVGFTSASIHFRGWLEQRRLAAATA